MIRAHCGPGRGRSNLSLLIMLRNSFRAWPTLATGRFAVAIGTRGTGHDLSAEHSMRITVGYSDPARGQCYVLPGLRVSRPCLAQPSGWALSV